MIIPSANEQETLNIAQRLAKLCTPYPHLIMYLQGELGAGKTTFTRGFLSYFGITTVRSPTYSIVESYPLSHTTAHHFDLYRISDAEELEYIGIREYLSQLCLIEWAELGKEVIAAADITIALSSGEQKMITLTALSTLGEEILAQW